MLARRICLLLSVAALALASACSSTPWRSDGVESAPGVSSSSSVTQYGRVSEVAVVARESSGVGGAVLGAVVGAVIGHQIGSGTGQDVATGLGAVGGALVGSQLQKRNESDVYRVTVRLDNGNVQTFHYDQIGDLRVGDRIKVEGGQLFRL